MAPFLAVFIDVLKASEYGILYLADTDQQQFFLLVLEASALNAQDRIPTSDGYPTL